MGSSTRTWLERSAWILAIGVLGWFAFRSFGSARSIAPTEVEARKHSTWIVHFDGL